MNQHRKAPAWRRYLRFWGSNVPDDVDDELRFHIEMRSREYVARGLTAEAAHAAALSRLGHLAHARDECLVIGRERERMLRQANMFESVKTDVKFATRSFLRSPGWTAVALLTIALGVGATTAVFSVVDGLLIHPMSYPGANRIFVVRHDVPFGANAHVYGPIKSQLLTTWRSARSLDAVEGYQRRDMTLTIGGEPQVVHTVSIDTSFLSFAGVHPIIGRNFSADEVAANAPHVALLSERYWRRQFGAAHDVLGKVVQADGKSMTIIGVLPGSLRLPDFEINPADLWIPRTNNGDQRLRGVLARLRPGVSTTVAEIELDSLIARAGLGVDEPPGSRMRLLRPGDTLGFRRTLVMLSGAVALLLLVACANVAHLLLARGAARERELAVRHALGAGRSRLIRQLLTESLVLTIVGGAAAIVVGGGGLRLLASLRPTKLSALSQFSVDQRVLLVASILTLSTGIIVGLLVALRTARRGIGEALRAGNGTGGTGRDGRRVRSTLVVTEIALSATLLVGALLLVHGVINLQNADLGFNARRLYGITFSGASASAAQRSELARQLLERGRRIPGVRGVTIAATVPPKGGFLMTAFETPARPTTGGDASTVTINSVAPNYFAVLGISLLGGRTFDARSVERNEVVINETLAKQLWPNDDGSPVGRRFRTAGNAADVEASQWYVVAAVARDAVMHGLLNDGVEPTLYFPLDGGLDANRTTLIVRGSDDASFADELRRLATVMRPGATLPTITNVEQELSDSIAEPRFSMRVLASFAVLAVVLAATGLYGVISYTVARRTREIGIRMTLGATPPAIARLIVADGLRLSVAGVGLGLLGAVAATRVIQTTLYGVQRGDLWSFAIGAVALLGISAAACLVPTIRATSVDPAVAVRAE
jgi:predicted permease